jgi:hypothetical protein
VRETVVVRGQITTRTDEPGLRTYDELARENVRLHEALRATASSGPREPSPAQVMTTYDNPDERALLKTNGAVDKEPISSLDEKEILLPSPQSSTALIAHDETANSWVHYALEYPRFAQQHSAFLAQLEHGSPLAAVNPSWLAVYFAVIAVR